MIPHRALVSENLFYAYGVKVRKTDGSKTSWPGSQFTHKLYHVYGHGPSPLAEFAIITEGESDAWILHSRIGAMTREVYALPSGSSCWKDHWMKDLERYRKVYICMDNDQAGKQARDKLERKIGWEKAEHLRVPPVFNDVREAVTKGNWDPSNLDQLRQAGWKE